MIGCLQGKPNLSGKVTVFLGKKGRVGELGEYVNSQW